MSAAFVLLIFTIMLVANIAVSAWNLLHHNGWQCVFSGLPLVLVACVAARVCFEVLRDPTSHNLWPLELGLVSIIGLFYSLFLRSLIALWEHRRRGLH